MILLSTHRFTEWWVHINLLFNSPTDRPLQRFIDGLVVVDLLFLNHWLLAYPLPIHCGEVVLFVFGSGRGSGLRCAPSVRQVLGVFSVDIALIEAQVSRVCSARVSAQVLLV